MAYSSGVYGSRGKGKRRFAPQGVWRSSESRADSEQPVVFLQRPSLLQRPPHVPSMHPPQKVKGRDKDEFYLAELAGNFWGPNVASHVTFNGELIEGVYGTLRRTNFAYRPIMSLEYSQYLENYLWPLFTSERASPAYVMSIVLMVNEKWRERVPLWDCFIKSPGAFSDFFHLVLDACSSDLQVKEFSLKERSMLLIFLVHSFNSLEVDLVREQVQRLVSLSIWAHLPVSRLDAELSKTPKLKKYWNVLQKKDKQLDEIAHHRVQKERAFLWTMIQQFLLVLSSIEADGDVNEDSVNYCERFLELVIDLEAQLPTRRFFNTLLDSSHLVVRCLLSALLKRDPEGRLFKRLLERVQFYSGFEINDSTGVALNDHDMTDIHYNKIVSLQRAAFKLYPSLRQFAMSNVASVDTRTALLKHFSTLSYETLKTIASHLHLVLETGPTFDPQLLLELIVCHHERRPSQSEAINDMPLYPTEQILWDENIVPSEFYSGETCLALPKLNLQFLTIQDYLLRNYILFRLESTYEIRDDIEDVVSRLKPWHNTDGSTEFAGWARMALPIATFSVVEVGQPNVGENRPSRVRADVRVELNVATSVKMEWEALRKHDVCFLVTVRARMTQNEQFDWSQPFVPQVGLEYVRGCEIEGMLDDDGKLIEEGPEVKPQLTGSGRTYRVWLDTNQYQQDMTSIIEGHEDVYETFNIFMRRKPKENNFKAVLETIRDLMNAECAVPEWLHDIFVGYGEASAAHYSNLTNQISTLDFNDTFLNFEHLRNSFPNYNIKCDDDPSKLHPPFKLVFSEVMKAGKKRKREQEEEQLAQPTISVQPYSLPNRGPYPYNQPKRNSVPFTPTQVEAIRSGMQPGLTLVVGPPGTGKTDVAVQIISNIYHNFPEQRTLLVTHSNQALNQLFEKIMCLDIDERHLVRLGHGEEELATEKDFSRFGRVNFILALRIELLNEVERLQKSLGVSGDVAYTCETAGHFFLYQVKPRWEEFLSKIKPLSQMTEGIEAIQKYFPFDKFFSNAPQPLFKGECYHGDWDVAHGCFRHITNMFQQLEEFRAFELLRSSRDRINYLLAKEAKIIAMTCTHAALKRRDLVELGFKYDNVLMEEAAQILEVETFIPLMLQNTLDGHNQLKRVIMIGDHHQLPPVIQNMAFQKYSNMEQSMFTRFVRLGVPTIQLDAQGRARASLCELYKWRYKTLGDLEHVIQWKEYCLANAGLRFDYQLINVEDFNGVGESEPSPHFYQNLAEAEYAVALFMYLRLQGYSPHKIAILTTYNGQKHLIRDVLTRRCARNPVFGEPEQVTTVDRYQGQQNDVIILSLVRTKHVGHIRDVRRLIVAMSRARLGLYILARVNLFQSCTELKPAFTILMRRPLQLHLVPDEFYPTTREVRETVEEGRVLVVWNMAELADYVFKDYQLRVNALKTRPPQNTSDVIMVPPPMETTPTPAASGETTPTPASNAKAIPTPTVSDETTPTPASDAEATPTPAVSDETTPTPASDAEATPTPAVSDETTPTPVSDAEATPTPAVSDETTPTPVSDAEATPTPTSSSEATPTILSNTETTPTPMSIDENTPTSTVKVDETAMNE